MIRLWYCQNCRTVLAYEEHCTPVTHAIPDILQDGEPTRPGSGVEPSGPLGPGIVSDMMILSEADRLSRIHGYAILTYFAPSGEHRLNSAQRKTILTQIWAEPRAKPIGPRKPRPPSQLKGRPRNEGNTAWQAFGDEPTIPIFEREAA